MFSLRGEAFQRRLLAQPDRDEDLVACAETFLMSFKARLTLTDPMRLIQELVDWIVAGREVTRVEQVASRAGMPTRSVQRLFQQSVGAGPKWVIQRSRLHEATSRLTGGQDSAMDVAHALGYADQAHVSRDFKRVVERTPAAYARAARAGSS